MADLDLKDRKILYELDLNCRQSNTQIGKKVGLSRKVVEYRIKRMEDEGIIKAYWTAINSFKLGYQALRIYIKFQDVTEEKKNEIIKYFTNYKNVWTVTSEKVPIDLTIVLWVNNIYEFYRFWNKTLTLYEKYFAEYTTSIYIQSINYNKTYLLDNYNEKHNRKRYETICDGTSFKIDSLDYKLLNELALNARIPLVELSEKLGCSSQNVNYRIKNLVKNNIIQGFRVNIDYPKINLQLFKIDIHLRQYKEREPIIKYLEKQPYFIVLNVAVGWADIEPEFVVSNVETLLEILDDINNRFSNIIKKQVFWIEKEQHKVRWLPEMKFS